MESTGGTSASALDLKDHDPCGQSVNVSWEDQGQVRTSGRWTELVGFPNFKDT